MERPTLDVLIVTHGPDGPSRVAAMQLPRQEGVSYIVSWQTDSPDAQSPESLVRPDITVLTTSSHGASANRNNCLNHSTADYCLVADDDLIYAPEAFSTVISTFENNPDVDVATFRASGADPKPYPEAVTDFSKRMPKGYHVTMFETAFRRTSVVGRVTFDETVLTAEDALFILDCRKAGLSCRFFPITIVEHPGLTTGYRPISNSGVVVSEGYYLRRCYGLGGLARVALFAWRNCKKGRLPLRLTPFLLKGYFTSRRKPARG